MPTGIGTLSTKGHVTVPRDIRKALLIRAGDKLPLELEGRDRAVVRKVEPQRVTALLDRLRPTKDSGVEIQRKLRREWSGRSRRP